MLFAGVSSIYIDRERWAAKPPTFSNGFCGRRGRLDPQENDNPDPPDHPGEGRGQGKNTKRHEIQLGFEVQDISRILDLDIPWCNRASSKDPKHTNKQTNNQFAPLAKQVFSVSARCTW